jgi:ureidoglycolate lyase
MAASADCGCSAISGAEEGFQLEVRLQARPITREAFRPFGQVIAVEGARHFTINDGTAERYDDLADIDVVADGGRPILNIFRAQPRSLPMRVTSMERHPLGSQAFMPLSPHPYLVVVAVAATALTAEDLRAFAVPGVQGVNYAKGTWHHPLIALEGPSDFLVIDRGGPGENCELAVLSDNVLIDWDGSGSNG